MDSGNDCGFVLRHPLAFAAEFHRRCVMNAEPVQKVADSLGFDFGVCAGVTRLVRVAGIPSTERLAVVAMKDWGLEDADIGEMFGQSEEWARGVRERQEEIREAEYIHPVLEWIDPGLQPSDPDPTELYRRAAEIRANRPGDWKFDTAAPLGRSTTSSRHQPRARFAQGGLRVYRWDGRDVTLVPIVAEKWAGSRT